MAIQYKTLVISLVDQTARRERMTHQLNQTGCDWEFVDGVKGASLGIYPAEYDRRSRLAYYGYDLTWGELGCLMSHRKAWQRVVDLNQTCLVLEDDVTILPNLKRALFIAEKLDAFWDLFRLHSGQDKLPVQLINLDGFKVFENLDDPGSSAAFIIKPAAAQRLLLTSSKFFMMNDDFVEARFLHGQRILALRPYPFEAGWGDSTINDRRAPRLGVLTRLRREFYRAPFGLKRWWFQLMRGLAIDLRLRLAIRRVSGH
jgi:glycosyl transferase, family 25